MGLKKGIAIIPARGGSKRLQRKNILPLGGIPLLSRVIRTAKDACVFDDIIVSSEDEEILSIALKEGVTAHARPIQFASDQSTVVDVCIQVLESYSAEAFCCIYATAAMISTRSLKSSAEVFFSDETINVLMGVSQYNHHPVQAITIGQDGNARLLFPEYQSLQSQFYPFARVSNGTFYWSKVETFLREKTFYSSKLRLFDVPSDEAFDIDTADDYEKLLKAYEKIN